MEYKPYNPAAPLTTPPVQNPHSPAAGGYKQQPVDMPGVISQTNNLYKPYTGYPNKDNK